MKNFCLLPKKIFYALILVSFCTNVTYSAASEEEVWFSSGASRILKSEANELQRFIMEGYTLTSTSVQMKLQHISVIRDQVGELQGSLIRLDRAQAKIKKPLRDTVLGQYENLLAFFQDAYCNHMQDLLNKMREHNTLGETSTTNIPADEEKREIDASLKDKRSLMRRFSTVILRICGIEDRVGIIPTGKGPTGKLTQFAYHLEEDNTYSTSSFFVEPGWNKVQFITSDIDHPHNRHLRVHYASGTEGAVYRIAPTAGLFITYKPNSPSSSYNIYEVEHLPEPYVAREQMATVLQHKSRALDQDYPTFAEFVKTLREDPDFKSTGKGFFPIPQKPSDYYESEITLFHQVLASNDPSLIRTVAQMIQGMPPSIMEVSSSAASGSKDPITPAAAEATPALPLSPQEISLEEAREIIETRLNELETLIREEQETRSAAVIAGITESTKQPKKEKKKSKKHHIKGKTKTVNSPSGAAEASSSSSSASSSRESPVFTGNIAWNPFVTALMKHLRKEGIPILHDRINGSHRTVITPFGSWTGIASSTRTISAFMAARYFEQARESLTGTSED